MRPPAAHASLAAKSRACPRPPSERGRRTRGPRKPTPARIPPCGAKGGGGEADREVPGVA
eukprot:1131977-Pyramimonas_sp.AAC.1